MDPTKSAAQIKALFRAAQRSVRIKNKTRVVEPVNKALRVGDEVAILTGHDRGKRGFIKEIVPKRSSVVIEGLVLTKRHAPADREGPAYTYLGERMVHASNVGLWDDKAGKAVRVRMQVSSKGKVRVSKASGAIIPFPEKPQPKLHHLATNVETDTRPVDVHARTYTEPDWEAIKAEGARRTEIYEARKHQKWLAEEDAKSADRKLYDWRLLHPAKRNAAGLKFISISPSKHSIHDIIERIRRQDEQWRRMEEAAKQKAAGIGAPGSPVQPQQPEAAAAAPPA